MIEVKEGLGMAVLLALAGALIKGMLESMFSSIGSGLGNMVVDGLKNSGKEEIATQLKSNPTPDACVAAQKTLAQRMQQNPTFRQQAETTLKTASPKQWDWAQSLSPQQAESIDWHNQFKLTLDSDWLKDYRTRQAAEFRRKYNISDQHYKYVSTGCCPIGGERMTAEYHAPSMFVDSVGNPAYQVVETSHWFWGGDADPYDDKLPKGSYAICSQNRKHTWWVYATGKARG